MVEFTEVPVEYTGGSIEVRVDEGEDIADLIAIDRESSPDGVEVALRLNASELAELIASAARALATITAVAARR